MAISKWCTLKDLLLDFALCVLGERRRNFPGREHAPHTRIPKWSALRQLWKRRAPNRLRGINYRDFSVRLCAATGEIGVQTGLVLGKGIQEDKGTLGGTLFMPPVFSHSSKRSCCRWKWLAGSCHLFGERVPSPAVVSTLCFATALMSYDQSERCLLSSEIVPIGFIPFEERNCATRVIRMYVALQQTLKAVWTLNSI